MLSLSMAVVTTALALAAPINDEYRQQNKNKIKLCMKACHVECA